MKRVLPRTLLAGFSILVWLSGARADTPVEYGVKGAYLYKFIPFVDWPASSFPTTTTPFTICILGRDPFGSGLDHAVADVKVNGRAIVIRRTNTPDAACHVAYIGDGAAAALPAFSGHPVLTVTDSGAANTGIVGFVIDDDHVRFDVDEVEAQRDGLSISSKLLSLAHAVKTRGGQP